MEPAALEEVREREQSLIGLRCCSSVDDSGTFAVKVRRLAPAGRLGERGGEYRDCSMEGFDSLEVVTETQEYTRHGRVAVWREVR